MLRFVRDTLTKAGYAPLVTGASEDLAGLIRAEQPKLVLLDLLLPGRDGIELLEEIPELSDLPVIFISGYGRDETIARAFEQGADDYIVKPFSPTELVARIRAALRRHREPEKFVLGELAIEYERHRVTVGGEAVELTNKEFELLRLLSINAGRVVHHDTLLRRIWEARPGADANLIRSSCGTCAASSATARRIRPGSSTSVASATGCRDPANADTPAARVRAGGERPGSWAEAGPATTGPAGAPTRKARPSAGEPLRRVAKL